MADITLTAAFSTVLGPDQEAIKRLMTETVEQIAQDDKSSPGPSSCSRSRTSAAGSPPSSTASRRRACRSQLDLEQLEDAQTIARARAPSSRRRCGCISGG